MLKVFRASVTNFPNQKFEERVQDPKIIVELKPVMDAWAVATTPPKAEPDAIPSIVPVEEPLVPPETQKEICKQLKAGSNIRTCDRWIERWSKEELQGKHQNEIDDA